MNTAEYNRSRESTVALASAAPGTEGRAEREMVNADRDTGEPGESRQVPQVAAGQPATVAGEHSLKL